MYLEKVTQVCGSSIKNWMGYAMGLFTHTSVTLSWIVSDYNFIFLESKFMEIVEGKQWDRFPVQKKLGSVVRFLLIIAGMGAKHSCLLQRPVLASQGVLMTQD